MKRFLTQFGAALIFLSAVAGVFLGAAAIHQTWLGGLVVGLATVWALLRVVAPRGLDWVNRMRNYPKLLNRAAALTQRLAVTEKQVQALQAEVSRVRAEAVAEGHMRVLGAVLSGRVKAMPELVAASVDNDKVVLIARHEKESGILVGARFNLEIIGTRRLVGVLQVDRVDKDTGDVHMTCVDPRDDAFWRTLSKRAEGDPSPPGGVRLVASEVPIPELLVELVRKREETE